LLEDIHVINEKYLSQQMQILSPSFEAAAQHLLTQPGKHLRTLVTVGWGLRSHSSISLDDLVEAALGVELIHEGSLIHDDVFDQSPIRRGQASIHARFGLRTANNFGLCLIARGVSLLCEAQIDYGIFLEVARINDVATSQLLESLPPCNSFAEQQRRMLQVTDGKTGVLFKFASTLGAAMAAIDSPGTDYRDAAERFGKVIGRAFQIRDDIADFCDDSGLDDKCGSDLMAGNWNWPTLYWAGLASDWPVTVAKVNTCQGNQTATNEILAEIRGSGALRTAKKQLDNQLAIARKIVEQLPMSPGRYLLQQFLTELGLP
jgi:heptaprenyl diphosphate synthase